MVASFFDKFYVTEVLEENTDCLEHSQVLEEDLRPVLIQNPLLGELTLNKQFSSFLGSFSWNESSVGLMLNVDKEDKSTWTATIDIDNFKDYNDLFGHPQGSAT